MFDARKVLGDEFFSSDDMSLEVSAMRFVIALPFESAVIRDGKVELTLTAEGLEKLISELNRLKRSAS